MNRRLLTILLSAFLIAAVCAFLVWRVVAARLQAGVVAQVKHCASGWCHVYGNGFDGWIQQERLWGVYADERVD